MTRRSASATRPERIGGVCAVAAVALALFGDQVPNGAAVAVLAALAGLVLRPTVSLPLLIVAAHLPALIVNPSVSRLAVVDLLVLAIVARFVVVDLRRVSGLVRDPLVVLAAGFLLVGAVATLSATEASAVTAYARVAAYVAVAVVTGLAVARDDRPVVLAAFVGVALGDTLAAVAGVTDTIPTGLPVGRYLGTLGDPGQFGIPVAAAFLMVVAAPVVIANRWLRWGVALVLLFGLFGSGTRSAWGAALVGGIGVLAVELERRGWSPRRRFLLGGLLGVVVVVAGVLFTIGAELVGLQPASASIRGESILLSTEYLVDHPFSPTGLGNLPGEFPAFNTWLAMAIALSPLAALLFAALVGIGLARAVRDPDRSVYGPSLAYVGATFTENTMFAGSSLTLTWFLLLGLLFVRDGDTAGRAGPL
jgi:hypothetical protein